MKKIGDIATTTVISKRCTESPIEVELFNCMIYRNGFVLCQEGQIPTGEGIFVFPQEHVGRYRADFIIRSIGYPSGIKVWPPKMQATICVECDGQKYHSTPEQIEYDKKRDEYFLSIGIPTIRYKGKDIKENTQLLVEEIAHKLQMQMHKNYEEEKCLMDG